MRLIWVKAYKKKPAQEERAKCNNNKEEVNSDTLQTNVNTPNEKRQTFKFDLRLNASE